MMLLRTNTSSETFDDTAVESRLRLAAIVAAALSAAVGRVHLLEAREHGDWWLAAGVFFVAIGVVQLASAVAVVWRRRPWSLYAMIWANLATILVYIASRTVGLPGSPAIPLHHGAELHAGSPVLPGGIEAVHSGDLVVLIAEVVVVVMCVALLAPRARRTTINALSFVGILLAGSWVATLL
jgi:hypothetical protein